jgi:hypothetical protein
VIPDLHHHFCLLIVVFIFSVLPVAACFYVGFNRRYKGVVVRKAYSVFTYLQPDKSICKRLLSDIKMLESRRQQGL